MPRTPTATAEPVLRLTIDAEALTIGDMEDLEIAESKQSIVLMLDWLEAHAGVTRDTLRALSLNDLSATLSTVGRELNRQMKLDPNSEQPS